MESVVLASILLLSPAAQEAVASEVLAGLLEDVAVHRALLADEASALYGAIEQWPQSPLRTRVLKRLTYIKQHHRLVSPGESRGTLCRDHWLDSDSRWDGVIGPTRCRCQAECHAYGVTPLPAYPDSELKDAIQHSGACSRPARTMQPNEFEQVVLRRWFHSTRWVQVVDWYCGRAWGRKWRENLRWLAETLREYSPAAEPEFQLRTEVPEDQAFLVKRAIEQTIQKAGCRPVVVCMIKAKAEFPHGRYLQTEQGWWRLDRGIDWKRSDGRMEAVDISAIDDTEAGKFLQAFPRVSNEIAFGRSDPLAYGKTERPSVPMR